MAIIEGEAAPAFELQDAAGARVGLGDFRGRHLVLYFYPRDDTPGCTKQACGFRDHWRELQALGVDVVGVSPDDEASHAAFSERYELPFVLLCDPEREVLARYGAWGEKKMYGRTSVGVIRSTVWIDPQGLVRKHWPRVARAADHPGKVLDLLRAEIEPTSGG